MSTIVSPVSEVAALLRAAGSAHHKAFLAMNGEDPEWPRWYAEYLESPLTQRGLRLPADRLAVELAGLDAEYRAESSAVAWPEYYAERLVGRCQGRQGFTLDSRSPESLRQPGR